MKHLPHHMTTEEFHRTVKVGSQLLGYKTRVRLTVSAIGRTRFLYLDRYLNERVASIESNEGRWQLVEPYNVEG